MINSPVNLEILLHCYYSPEPLPRYDAPATKEGVLYLLRNDMISIEGYVKEESKDIYRATAKGEFYIKHLMTVPFPISTWSIPDG